MPQENQTHAERQKYTIEKIFSIHSQMAEKGYLLSVYTYSRMLGHENAGNGIDYFIECGKYARRLKNTRCIKAIENELDAYHAGWDEIFQEYIASQDETFKARNEAEMRVWKDQDYSKEALVSSWNARRKEAMIMADVSKRLYAATKIHLFRLEYLYWTKKLQLIEKYGLKESRIVKAAYEQRVAA